MAEDRRIRHNFRLRCTFGVLIALTLAFIWGNSMQSGAASGEMSGSLKALLDELLGTQIDEFLLRKAAHFSEYALLGFECAALLSLLRDADGRSPAHGRNLFDCPALGLLAAVIDETIQIFSGRGSMVVDVWIDTAGFVTGFFLTIFIFRLCRRRTHKERTNHP